MVLQLLRKKRKDTTRNHGFTIITQKKERIRIP